MWNLFAKMSNTLKVLIGVVLLVAAICVLSLFPRATYLPQIPPSEIVHESTFDSPCCYSYEVEHHFTADSVELCLFYDQIVRAARNAKPYDHLFADYKEIGREHGIGGSVKIGWYVDREDQFYCYAAPLSRTDTGILSQYGIKLYQFVIGDKNYHVSYHN